MFVKFLGNFFEVLGPVLVGPMASKDRLRVKIGFELNHHRDLKLFSIFLRVQREH